MGGWRGRFLSAWLKPYGPASRSGNGIGCVDKPRIRVRLHAETPRARNERMVRSTMKSIVGCVCCVLVNVAAVLPAVCQWQRCASPGEATIWAIQSKGAALYLGTMAGVMVSRDHGDHWLPASSGLLNLSIASLAARGPSLFAGAVNNEKGESVSLFRSTDGGKIWTIR